MKYAWSSDAASMMVDEATRRAAATVGAFIILHIT
jgi:hypothetical protein